MKNAFFNQTDGYNEKMCERKHPADTVRVQELDHLAEIYNQKDFVDLDGKKLDLSTIKEVPVICYFGAEDTLVNIADAKWISTNLKTDTNGVHSLKKYNHSSFLIGKDMSYAKDLLKDLKKFNPVSKK